MFIKYIKIRNEKIPYKLKKEHRKSLSIRWKRKKKLFQYCVPVWIDNKDINQFLKKNKDKIYKKFKIYTKKYKNGNKLKYLGKNIKLKIRISDNQNYIFKMKNLNIFIKEKSNETIKEVLHSFYKKRAEVFIPARLDFHSKKTKIPYNNINLKNQKTLWGSASDKRNININYRLMLAPIEIIDYVLLHELVHLKIMNHSKEYWNELKKYLKNIKKSKKWLKNNHYKLII